MDGGHIGIVCLNTRINRLPEATGGERMNQTYLIAGSTEGVANEVVVAARAFDGDQLIFDVVALESLAQLVHGRPQVMTIEGHDRGRDQHVAIEIAEHPFAPWLGTIDTDDAKMLRYDLLHAWVYDTLGLLDS